MEDVQELSLRCIFFANDIILLGESKEDLNERLKTRRRALETHDFLPSISKTKYMKFKISKRKGVSNIEVKFGDHTIHAI